MDAPLIELKNLCKSFKKDKGQALAVLQDVNFSMREGEIVALVGKSGSGKSTLLRLIAGLLSPSKGEVYYRGRRVTGPVQGMSMVFQHFALMPWLTVLQNVELGLEAMRLSAEERRRRSLKAIDTIGLDGFESAYPKELSGGMRQRVGFARALVVEPDVLLMDEPFSALDVLTADNLKGDLLDLWQMKKTKTSGILLITHNIEEAVYLADRIIIFESDPGRVKEELEIRLPHPRVEADEAFRLLVDKVYRYMTRKTKMHHPARFELPQRVIDIHYRLPDVTVSELAGLLETLNEPDNRTTMDLPKLAGLLSLDVDALFPLIEVLEILRFARVSEGDIALTDVGQAFSDADILTRKKIFSKQLLSYIALAKHIRDVLDERPKHRASETYFLDELNVALSEEEAERVLRVMIDWGRYAELFAYDVNSGELSLENPN